MARPSQNDEAAPAREEFERVVDELRRALAEIRHGSVTLIVQDGRVIQIDSTRKLRLGDGRGQ